MPLTDLKVRALRPREKAFKTADADGLYVLTTPTGTRLWRMDYRFDSKRKTLALGAYPTIPLIEARRLRTEARGLLANGIDPCAHKPLPSGDTFRVIADRWFDKNEKQWVGSYSIRLRNRLTDDVFPTLGPMPIAAIKPRDVLATIRKIEERGAVEMGRRVFQMVSAIFRFAVAEDIIESDPTRDISDALAAPNPTKHRNALRPEDLPGLVRQLAASDTISALAARWTIHTMVRTGETRFATWDEIDSAGLLWRIPTERMKMRRDHIVPLTPQALAILDCVPRVSKWVFKTPGRMDKPISENAMLYFLYGLGAYGKATMHGMRSSASTWLNEHEFNRDWIEIQLAHVDGSVRGVYNSALYLRQRREMLQAWSDYLEPDEFGDLL